ncbi:MULTISPECIES: hypothetical protein [Photorhabdus]|uniref:Uncharacterized protein n=2 Tax=Photorhabdus TaxID=29487 RepID=A0A0F7LPX3_9GAMM|nr:MULTISPECIES: hypothetical protein [Photorhabdus]AKH63951.1 hypothetical protein VY86_12060 [Photorhabdus thracensis]MCC8374670.1 hypothetical protein [Photorhabdus bodei]NDL13607.1 hypothetical protein [Photorhabdus kayaii]NDL27167.1 hypothetical protein [Photorhabdus kayaii]RAX07587.1 hypothetical protein CKY10_17985 [Photorhabdus sp. HUG-39]
MKIIITTIKIVSLTFLVLFFISGLGFRFDTEPKNKSVVKAMLFISGSVLCFLFYRWIYLPRKGKKEKEEKSNNLSIRERWSLIKNKFSAEYEKAKKESNEREPTKRNSNSDAEPSLYSTSNGEAIIWEGTSKPDWLTNVVGIDSYGNK